MNLNKKQVILFFLIHLITISYLGLSGNIPLIIVVLVYYYVGMLVKQKSNVHMMFFLGYTTFLFLPTVLNWYYLDVSTDLFLLSSIAAAIFLRQTRHTIVHTFIDKGSVLRYLFTAISISTIFLILIGFPKIANPIFPFLIILLSMSFKQDKIAHNSYYLCIFLIVFIVYSLFGWNGFGRTVLMGWLLLALLQYLYSVSLYVNKFVFALLPGFGASLLVSRDLFDLKFGGFEKTLSDSAYGPYRLASTFITEFKANGYDISGFLDQVIFTFLIFIPRKVWPDKPFGFGFEYTVRNLDPSLIDAGHSIAATLIGEHIYFLGYLGVITSIVLILAIAWVTNMLYKLPGMNGHSVIIFSSSMMVLSWGGMTSFSARVIMPTIVFISIYVTFNKVLKNNYRLI